MKKTLVWIDLEMTGLDVEKDVILEVAVLVTDDQLNVVDEGLDLIVHCDDETLAGMNDWCVNQHGTSGLTQACKDSGLTIADVEKQVMEYLRKHCEEGKAILCGNSVWIDKVFIMKQMKQVYDFLNYRIIDVTTVKELAKRWTSVAEPMKKETHRALDDIKESIEELKLYKKEIFRV